MNPRLHRALVGRCILVGVAGLTLSGLAAAELTRMPGDPKPLRVQMRFETPAPPPAKITPITAPAPATTTTTVVPEAPAAAPAVVKQLPAVIPAAAPTTTTTAPPPAATVLAGRDAVLDAAQATVGKTPAELELGVNDFWCAVYASRILGLAGYAIHEDSPARLRSILNVADTPRPGDFVFVSFQPGVDQADHVAVVESVNADGSVNTIEGNGPDRERVARGVRQPAEIIGFGTVDHLTQLPEPWPWEPFNDPICDVKPWICDATEPS